MANMDSKKGAKPSYEEPATAVRNPDLPPPYSDIDIRPATSKQPATTSQQPATTSQNLATTSQNLATTSQNQADTSQNQANTSNNQLPLSIDQFYMPRMFQHLPEHHQNILEFLGAVDQLLVKKKFIGCCKAGEKYTLKDTDGHKLMQTIEEPDRCCSVNRCCLLSTGPIDMKIFDHRENEIIHLTTPNAYECCFYFCKPKKLEVYIMIDKLVAVIEQEGVWSTRRFIIRNAAGQEIFKVKGSKLFTRSNNFKVLSMDENVEVGFITNSLRKHAFKINFVLNLDVTMKAAVIGAAFFINFMVYKNMDD